MQEKAKATGISKKDKKRKVAYSVSLQVAREKHKTKGSISLLSTAVQ